MDGQSESPTQSTADERRLALALIIASSVLISFGGLLVRNIEAADPWQINLHRAIGLAVVVAINLAARYGKHTVRKVAAVGWPGLAAGALLGVAGITYLQSITHTTVANTLFVIGAIPFFTACLAWLILKERLRRVTVIAMAVAAVGIGVMVGEGLGAGSAYGNAMALVTAMAFAGFAVLVRRHRGTDMLPALLISALLIVAVSGAATFGRWSISFHDLLLCWIWGGLLSGVGNWMFIVAARHLAAGEVTLFMLVEFSLGPLWVWLFVGEVASMLTLAGGALVLSAVVIQGVFDLRRR